APGPGRTAYFFRLCTYATTLSRSAPVTLATGFIFPCPSAITFFTSTVEALSGLISTFSIFATAAFPSPSAPWQDLHLVAYTALPAAASAAHAPAGDSAAINAAAASPATRLLTLK